MQRFQVTKVIEFSYGHRLLEHQGKCRHLRHPSRLSRSSSAPTQTTA